MRESLYNYCVRTEDSTLLEQWDEEKNESLSPETVSYGSKHPVWWRCSSGHSWQATVTSRTSGYSGCPYCAGVRPIPGQTDLASQFPMLAAQWHPSKNAPLTPEQVLPGSHRKVWWVCEKGHIWQAQIKSRVSGCGCPYCANHTVAEAENDLAAQYPDLAVQWHPIKNGALTARDVLPGTNRKVWWICGKGHEWQASVSSRTSGGSGCPVCSGKKVIEGETDLAAVFPAIAAQWHPTRNAPLTPGQISPYSNRRVWWQCDKGHAYRTVVAARTMRGSGCPYCAGRKVLPGFNDLATRFPDLAAQWHPTLNGSVTPDSLTPGSNFRAWWVCPLGHVWKAYVYSRTGSRKCGCPVCAGKVKRKRKNSEVL